MPNPSIGGFQFIILRGGVDIEGEQLETLARQGVNGTAFRKVGRRNEPVILVSIADVLDAPATKAIWESYKALQGTSIQLIEDNGTTWDNVVVLNVRRLGFPKKMATSVGGLVADSQFLVTVEWQLILSD